MKKQLLAHLSYMKDIGVEYSPALSQQAAVVSASSDGESMSPQADLQALWKNEVDGCIRCKLAECGRNTIVFGDGSATADLMFIGEGPGRDEDLQGKPFVGRAGKKLTEIIEAMKLSREEVYIANIVKCRPPGNRNPEADEVASCIPFLHKQIDIIKPKVICALGSVSAQTLLGVDTPISKMRGQFFEFHGVPLMPTFHPAYLLRNYTPETRRKVWNDMQKIMDKLQGKED